MTPNAIAEILGLGKDSPVKFVSAIRDMSDVGKVVCGYLNGAGGYLIIGMETDGTVSSSFQDDDVLKLEQDLYKKITPRSPVFTYTNPWEGKDLVIVEVPAGKEAPYAYDHTVYISKDQGVTAADGITIRDFVARNQIAPERWERRFSFVEFPDEIDDVELLAAVKEAVNQGRTIDSGFENKMSLLESFGVARYGKITNAGDVLFAKNPALRNPQCRVSAYCFANDRTDNEFLDSSVFEGPLCKSIEQAYAFIVRNTRNKIRFVPGLRHERESTYPANAVREALVNAMAHRNYSDFSRGVDVRVFPNRLEIWNSGELPQGIKDDDLGMGHISVLQNPDISQVLYLRGYMEKAGRGCLMISTECEKEALPKPKWTSGANQGVTITLFGPVKFDIEVEQSKERFKRVQNVVGTPVTPADFFGRLRLISSLEKSLMDGRSVFVTGDRRIGKTSLAMRLMERATEAGWRGIYLDLSDCSSEFQFLNQLVDRISKELSNSQTRILANGLALLLSGSDNALPEFGSQIEPAIDRLLEQIDKLGIHLLICLDEFDFFIQKLAKLPNADSRAEAFLMWFRSVRMRYSHRLHWMVLGVRDESLFQRSLNDVMHVEIPPMESSEASDFLLALANNYQLSLSEPIRKEILNQIGIRTPYNIQVFFNGLRELEKQTIEHQDVIGVAEKLAPRYYLSAPLPSAVVKETEIETSPKVLEGLEIAQQRISKEKQEKTGILNLGGLGLTELPNELFELDHLRILSLGSNHYDESGTPEYQFVESDLRTRLDSFTYPFAKLAALEILDLNRCVLSDLSPLSGQARLKSLYCSGTQVSDLGPLSGLASLRSFDCSDTQVSDLSPLSGLESLTSLDCSDSQVSDLGSLSGIASLTSLSCRSTLVSDLGPLAGLASLLSLDCSRTEVSDLSPLSGLSSLSSLSFWRTQVSDLSPLSGLSGISSLSCWRTQVSDLGPLSGLSGLTSLSCWSTQVSDLGPLSGLANLASLYFSDTQVSDLSQLSGLTKLTSLDCRHTQVRDLGPLSGLVNLTSVYCRGTQVSDLGPLTGLSNLTSLDCSFTQVSDLGPLSGLASLTSLDCSGTQVNELSLLSVLSNLTSLDCSGTQVNDLGPLSGLASLTSLNCSGTQVNELSLLSGLSNLTRLDCSSTQVRDLGPLSGLTNLRRLDCSSTQVSDLRPLSGQVDLTSLDCSRSQVTNLDGFAGKSEFIFASNLALEQVPRKLLANPSLETLILHESTIPGIPPEVLSTTSYENCLPKLRAHLADLEQGAAAAHDIKLIIIGNGRIGKTQIARRLLGLQPESEPDSTHGISISSIDLESSYPGLPKTRVHLWDFGGQDIYHGTHTLFMRTNAIFLLVWTNRSEETGEHEYHGLTFRNFKIAYWLEHIGHLADYQQPVLVIQNQCDTPQDESIPKIPQEIATKFSHLQFRAYSALRDRGRAALDQAIQEAISETIQRRGAIFIGQGRAKVKLRLDAMREEDQSRPPAERRYQTISQEFFQSLCQEAGNISSVKYFLEYLHECGLFFYRQGMFDDQIVLDQAWALQAIYTVLDRKGPYQALQSLKGRFSRSILAASVWQEYSEQEQNVFLSMMQSCGVCFIHREANNALGIEAEYVAPDLLPERESVRVAIASQWEQSGNTCNIECQYSYHDPSLTRSILAEIGKRAKDSAIYWRYGACGYDLESRSHFLIEQHSNESLGGRITIVCKGPAASSLATELRKLVEGANSQYGIREVVWTGDETVLRSHDLVDRLDLHDEVSFEIVPGKSDKSVPRLRLGYESKESAHEYFVSYAWGDDTPQGLERTKAIEELCEKAAKAGIKIVRDSTHMQVGDRISNFMDRIGSGQRVFVILSKKYLESEFCMYELWSIWKNCQEDPKRFLSKIRVYKLPDARIAKTVERLQCASYWVEQKAAIDELVKKHGMEIIGGADLQKYRCMAEFASHTSEMLSLISDVLKASDFDALLAHGFDGVD